MRWPTKSPETSSSSTLFFIPGGPGLSAQLESEFFAEPLSVRNCTFVGLPNLAPSTTNDRFAWHIESIFNAFTHAEAEGRDWRFIAHSFGAHATAAALAKLQAQQSLPVHFKRGVLLCPSVDPASDFRELFVKGAPASARDQVAELLEKNPRLDQSELNANLFGLILQNPELFQLYFKDPSRVIWFQSQLGRPELGFDLGQVVQELTDFMKSPHARSGIDWSRLQELPLVIASAPTDAIVSAKRIETLELDLPGLTFHKFLKSGHFPQFEETETLLEVLL